MNFRALASSSSGNCYLLSDQGESVLIEAGIPWKKIQQALDFNTQGIRFCLASHSHGDHSRHVKDVLRAGIDVYASDDVGITWGVSNHHRLHALVDSFPFRVGSWGIVPFPVVHDAPCHGFVVGHGGWKCLYLSDSMYSPYRFNGLTHIAVEVNYSRETLAPNLDPARKHRLLQNHMSLETVKGLLKANDLSRVVEIWLLHLSNDNSNAKYFKREIEKQTGKPVYVAGA